MLNSIDELIKSGKYPSVLLLFGSEDFLMEESLNKLIKNLILSESDSYNFDMLDAEETTGDQIASICSAFPMMSERRVVVVKRFEKLYAGRAKKTDKAAPLTKYIENPSPSTLLILTTELETMAGLAAMMNGKNRDKGLKKIESAKAPYDTIFGKHEWIEFPRVYESNFASWAVQRFKKAGKTIEPEAAELLVAHTVPTLRDLNNEIDKICTFLDAEREVTVEHITQISGVSRNYNVFELQKAIGNRNMKLSMEILENMLANDRQEMLIITVLTKYFITLWKVVEESAKGDMANLANRLGVNQYFLKDYTEAARRYKPQDISRAFLALETADATLKTSASNPLFIMQNMLLKIIDK